MNNFLTFFFMGTLGILASCGSNNSKQKADTDSSDSDIVTGTDLTAKDQDSDGYLSSVDCDDSNPDIHPGASEPFEPNGVDENCDKIDGHITDSSSDTVNKDSETGSETDSSSDTVNKDSETGSETDSSSDTVNKDSETGSETDSSSDTVNKDSETGSETDSSSDTDTVISERIENITKPCGTLMPAPVSGGSAGWGSRYWDCCKPHCSWINNVNNDPSMIARNCDINDVEVAAYEQIVHEYWTEEVISSSGCDNADGAYTCFDNAPYAVCENLAYGFAAVPFSGADACGKCFQLDFDGGVQNGTPKAAHKLLAGKTMIVMGLNTGGDPGGEQFDLMIPGGGLGIFKDGCQREWNVDVNNEALVGATYGGLLTTCYEDLASAGGEDASIDSIKSCVRTKCDNLFGGDSKLTYLLEGCYWFVDWYHTANNPTFTYKEVTCPAALTTLYKTSF